MRVLLLLSIFKIIWELFVNFWCGLNINMVFFCVIKWGWILFLILFREGVIEFWVKSMVVGKFFLVLLLRVFWLK